MLVRGAVELVHALRGPGGIFAATVLTSKHCAYTVCLESLYLSQLC